MLSVEVLYAIQHCEELLKVIGSEARLDVRYNIVYNALFSDRLCDKLFDLGMSRQLFNTLPGSTVQDDVNQFETGLLISLVELKKLRTALEAE